MEKKYIRNQTCSSLSDELVGKEIILNGWVYKLRDMGNILFFTLRDRYGVVQIICEDESTIKEAKKLGYEYCVAVVGNLRKRPDDMVNKDMQMGKYELVLKELKILSTSEPLPFPIVDESKASEELHQKYRYLYLRTPSMQKKIALRNKVTFIAREFFQSRGHYEIETPTMIRSTPEGARDFVVPSRLNPGKFWALPQSPQLFKQLLMVSGFDKYFQIAHCFRDEDPRGDRQIEHTQIDVEMSFVSEEMIFEVINDLFDNIMEKSIGYKVKTPFPVISYHDAMNKYGSDKPDLRYNLEFKTANEVFINSKLQAFESVLKENGTIKALKVESGASLSRKQIEELEASAKVYKAGALFWTKIKDSKLEGGISKFIENSDEVIKFMDAKEGDIIFYIADKKWKVACTSMGAVRIEVAKIFKLIDPNKFEFCIVNEFPLFSYNETENKWDAEHHIFTMPKEEYLIGTRLEDDPGAVKGQLYDLVLNGYELASGSIRIHEEAVQKRVMNIIQISEEQAELRFGFLLRAFKYGPPPHGGFASGLDRIVMILAGESSIKEVIAFPKNNMGVGLMDESPAPILKEDLDALHIKLDLKE